MVFGVSRPKRLSVVDVEELGKARQELDRRGVVGFGDAAEMSLFDTERDGKKKNLYDAIDTLKKRFGENIVTKAPLVKNNNETE